MNGKILRAGTVGIVLLGLGVAKPVIAKVIDFGWSHYVQTNKIGFNFYHSNDNLETTLAVPIDDPDATTASINLRDGLNYVYLTGRTFDGNVYKESSPSEKLAFWINDDAPSAFGAFLTTAFLHNDFSYVDNANFNPVSGGTTALVDVDDKFYAVLNPPNESSMAKVPLSSTSSWQHPMLKFMGSNVGIESDIGLIVEDAEGKRAYYDPIPLNFNVGDNTKRAMLDAPTMADDGFNANDIDFIYVNGLDVDLESILVTEGGISVSDNLVKGTNTKKVAYSSDFDQFPEFYATIIGQATRRTLRKRYAQAKVNIDSDLNDHKEFLLELDMDPATHGLLGDNGIQLAVDGVTYTIPKVDIATTPKEYVIPLLTSNYVGQGTLTVWTAARLSTKNERELITFGLRLR